MARNQRAAAFVAILWSCLIGLLSVLPERFVIRGGFRGSLHAVGHVLVFCVTAAVFSACAQTGKLKAFYGAWALLLALMSEWLETVVFHNHFEWADILLDFVGIAFGLVLVGVLGVSSGRPTRVPADNTPEPERRTYHQPAP